MVAEKDSALVNELIRQVPAASRRLVEQYFVPLSRLLRKHLPFVPNESVDDAAYDALLALIQSPQNFDPKQSSLLTYLYRIAKNKVIDLFQLHQRRKLEIFVGGSVALAQAEENNYRAGQISERMPIHDKNETLPPDIMQLLEKILPDSRDRRIWDMICDGRQDTADYAQLLGITHLPLNEQKAEVKRHRERVSKRVRRHQDEFRKRFFGEAL